LSLETDFTNAIKIKNFYIQQTLPVGGFAVDATAGNGHDLLLLSNRVGEKGRVIGFDIQEEAIDNSLSLLKSEAAYNNYKLVLDSHTMMKTYIEREVDVFVYNLGYLPGGDKTKTTLAKDTIISIEVSMSLLKRKGSIFIVSYPGHEGGYKEERAIYAFTEKLNQKKWSVMRTDFINQVNHPPVLYIIQKR